VQRHTYPKDYYVLASAALPSQRSLYRELSMESVGNAKHFLADAKRLKQARSRGHAIALTVLSIEEASKALVYHNAAEGVLRIVGKNPNHITTFQERELPDHRFKHTILAGLLAEWIRYAPFYEAAERLRKPRLTKEEVREVILGAIHAHRLLQVDLASGGRTAKDVKDLFELLEQLNDLKNRGFYVDHAGRRMLLPNDLTRRELERLLELGEGAIEMVSQLATLHYTEREKRLQIEANKELLKRARRARIRSALQDSAQASAHRRAGPKS